MRVAFACATTDVSSVVSWASGNGLTIAFSATSGSYSLADMVIDGEDLTTFLDEATDNGVFYVTQEETIYGLGAKVAYDTLLDIIGEE